MRRNYSITPALSAWRFFIYMLWYTIEEDVMDVKRMEGEEVFTREDIFVEGVIRLRGGAIGMSLRSGRVTGLNKIVKVARVALRTAKRARTGQPMNIPEIVSTINGVLNDLNDGVEPVTTANEIEVYEEGPKQPGKIELRGGSGDTVMGGVDTTLLTKDVVKMFKFQRLTHTAYTYNMSPVAWTTENIDRLAPGVGPALYWITDESLANTANTEPNRNFGYLRPLNMLEPITNMDSLNSINGIVYVFAADWYGAQMNHSEPTKTRLQWVEEPQIATTDPNTPITLLDLVGSTPNKDWSVIRHYATHYDFMFTNLAPYPYVVEVLFFKWKVDPEDLGYRDQLLAPLSNQNDMQSYCNNNIRNFGTQQITVLKRHRQRIFGLDNSVVIPANSSNGGSYMNIANSVRSNVGRYSFKLRHKYDTVRGVKQGDQTVHTETSFFDNFYNPDKGVYCRVQGWPEIPLFSTNPNNNASNTQWITLNNIYDAACQPTTTIDFTRIKPALQCQMKKRSYIKVDTPTLRGPFLP